MDKVYLHLLTRFRVRPLAGVPFSFQVPLNKIVVQRQMRGLRCKERITLRAFLGHPRGPLDEQPWVTLRK